MLPKDAVHKLTVLFKSYEEGFDEYLNLVRDKEKFGDEKTEELRMKAEEALYEYTEALGELYFKMKREMQEALDRK